MKVFRRYQTDILFLFGFAAVFLLMRFFQLLSLPIFTDEAIYTRWAQIASQDANLRFISLTDGKQPLFIWLDAFMMRLVHDPLMSGRIISVLAGLATMIGLYFLGREVFKNRWVGIVSAFLYLLYPFGLVYDRMALYDSLVGTFTVWGLYCSVLLVKRVRSDFGFILGFVLGIGTLNKTSAFLNVYLLPLTLLLFDWRKKDRTNRLIQWIVFSGIAIVITYSIYSILRLSPWFYIIAQKDTTFVYPFKEWLLHPFTFFIGNLNGLADWFVMYMSIPIFVLIVASFFIRGNLREKILLGLWFILPFVALALFGKVLYPRYILFMTLTLLPLAAVTIVYGYRMVTNKLLFGILLLLFILPFLRADFLILTDFAHAPIPQSDLGQLINDWPSGGGVRESVAFLEEKSKKGKIHVVTQGTFGLMPYGLEIYLIKNKNITIDSRWPIPAKMPQQLLDSAKIRPTYLFFYQPCVECPDIAEAPKSWPVKVIARYKKGIGKVHSTLYEVIAK